MLIVPKFPDLPIVKVPIRALRFTPSVETGSVGAVPVFPTRERPDA